MSEILEDTVASRPNIEAEVNKTSSVHPTYPMGSEQLFRLLQMGLSSERRDAIKRRYQLSNEVLEMLTPSKSNPAIMYIYRLYGDFSKSRKGPERVSYDESLHKPILDLIDKIFTDPVIEANITYSAMYYSHERKHEEVYRFLLVLLHSWKTLGGDHPRFGKIPIRDNATLSEEMEATFRAYTTRTRRFVSAHYGDDFEFRKGEQFAFSILLDQENTYSQGVIGLKERGPLPKTFALLELYDKEYDDMDQTVDYLEEVYVLGLWKRFLPLSNVILFAFFRRHREMLENFTENDWQALDSTGSTVKLFSRFLENEQKEQGRKDNTKVIKKKRQPQRNPISTLSGRTHIMENGLANGGLPIRETIAYPTPSIRNQTLEKIIWNQEETSLSASDLCTNIPDGAYLCIGEYEIAPGNSGQKTLVWHNTRYSPSKSIRFPSSNRNKREFIFCFVPDTGNIPPSKNLPHIALTFERPREKTVRNVQEGVPSRVNTALTAMAPPSPIQRVQPSTTGSITPPSISIEYGPTDTLALQMLESLDSITFVRDSPTQLHLPIGEDIRIEYDVKNHSFQLHPTSERIDMEQLRETVGDDLERKVSTFLEHELSDVISTIRKTEEPISSKLLSQFQNFSSRDEILAECRQNSHFTGSVLLMDKSIAHLQELQGTFSTVGLAISIARKETEMELTLTLRNLGKQYTITSIPGSPFFTIQNQDTLTNGERQMLMDIFLMLGMLGRSLITPNTEALRQSAPRHQSGPKILSHDDILHIIRGTYKTKPLLLHGMAQEQKNMLAYAIKRLDECEGRKLYSEGFHADTGYYSCIIEGHKGWDNLSYDDLIILVDEKISIAPEGKKGHPYIHDMIDGNTRLQKYLVLKMIATITGKPFRGKRPFTNGMRDCFLSLWKRVSDNDQIAFLEAVAGEQGSAGKALALTTADGTNILRTFLDKLRVENIALIYSRPFAVSVHELREFQKQMDTSDLEAGEFDEE